MSWTVTEIDEANAYRQAVVVSDEGVDPPVTVGQIWPRPTK